jgi:hypothetical protein
MFLKLFLLVLLINISFAKELENAELRNHYSNINPTVETLNHNIDKILVKIVVAFKKSSGDELHTKLKEQMTKLLAVIHRTTARQHVLVGPYKQTVRRTTVALSKLDDIHDKEIKIVKPVFSALKKARSTAKNLAKNKKHEKLP